MLINCHKIFTKVVTTYPKNVNVNKRYLMSVSRVSRVVGLNNVSPYKTSVLQKRDLQISGGKFNDKQANTIIPSTKSDLPEEVQSDQSGYHKLVVVKSCTDYQCHNKLCDSLHENVCSLKQGDTTNAVSELGGALTHKIPANKKGIELAPDNINGETKNGSQKLVQENTTVPVDESKFKQDVKVTEYVQQAKISKNIVQALPSNSPVNLKETSSCNSPNDDEI